MIVVSKIETEIVSVHKFVVQTIVEVSFDHSAALVNVPDKVPTESAAIVPLSSSNDHLPMTSVLDASGRQVE